jgi:hypothetical protein
MSYATRHHSDMTETQTSFRGTTRESFWQMEVFITQEKGNFVDDIVSNICLTFNCKIVIITICWNKIILQSKNWCVITGHV